MLFPLFFSLVVSLPPAPARFDYVSVSMPAAIPKAKFCQCHLLLKARHFYCRVKWSFPAPAPFPYVSPSACTFPYTLPAASERRWFPKFGAVHWWLSGFPFFCFGFSWGWPNYSWLGLAGQHGLPSLPSSLLADFSVVAEKQGTQTWKKPMGHTKSFFGVIGVTCIFFIRWAEAFRWEGEAMTCISSE